MAIQIQVIAGSLSLSHPVKVRYVVGTVIEVSEALAKSLVDDGSAIYVDSEVAAKNLGIDEVPGWLKEFPKNVQAVVLQAGLVTPEDCARYGVDQLILLPNIGEPTARRLVAFADVGEQSSDDSSE